MPKDPNRYDPETDVKAEHLAQAAWHLSEINAKSDSDRLLAKLVRELKNVPISDIDGCKHAGSVSYHPLGTVNFERGGELLFQLAAPAEFVAPALPRPTKAARKKAKEAADHIARKARWGWFPRRQVLAWLDGKTPKGSRDMPARMLNGMIPLLAEYEAAMDGLDEREAQAMAFRLLAILRHSNIADTQMGRFKIDAARFGRLSGGEYRLGFAFFDEDTVTDTGVQLIRNHDYRHPENKRFYELRPHIISWNKAGAVPEALIGKITEAAEVRARRLAGEDLIENDAFLAIVPMALGYAAFAAELAQLHKALVNTGDPYLDRVLPIAGMVDRNLDPDPRLPWRVARLLLHAKPEGEVTPEITETVMDSIRKEVLNLLAENSMAGWKDPGVEQLDPAKAET